MHRLRWFVSALVWGCFGMSGSSSAAPVMAAVAFVATSLGASAATALAVAQFVTFVVLPNIALTVVSRIAQQAAMPDAQARQASVTTLSLGEGPREFAFGELAVAGQLVDAYNFGVDEHGTDYESLVIALADHEIDALLGFYIGDQYYPFMAEGDQPGFREQLKITFRRGTLDQAPGVPPEHTGGRWTEADNLAGVAYVVVTYLADVRDAWKDAPMWSTGRPQFLWHIRGAKLYDPSKDDTVAGGHGPQRWTDPSTWTWSNNAYLARYNFARGIYAGGQVDDPAKLLIGRGLSADEAPPERAISRVNICNELVALKDGGTEPRYRANGVVRADEAFIAVEEMFAAAMGGVITQPEGGVEIDPGVAKAVVFEITDDDLAVGFPVKVEQFVSDAERVNTVLGRYVAADQLWRDVAAPIRRSSADIIADGGPRLRTLPLSFVTSHTQAQRIAEIERRLARREKRASLTLSPRFSKVEEGDWIVWTSARHFGGASVTFRVEAQSVDQGYRASVLLRQIDSQAYAWTAATDEGTPGEAPIEAGEGALALLALQDVNVQAFEYVGDDGSRSPAILASWATPIDASIVGVRLEVRKPGAAEVSSTMAAAPSSGLMVTGAGVTPDSALEARLVPIPGPGRGSTPTAWLPVNVGPLIASGIATIGGQTVAQVAQDLAAASGRGLALTRAVAEQATTLFEARKDLIKARYIGGVEFRSYVQNEVSERLAGQSLILSRMALMGVASPDGSAWHLNSTTLTIDGEQTLASYIDGVQAQFGAAEAAWTTQIELTAGPGSALATQVSTLSTSVAGHTASITSFASSIGGLNAQYVFSMSAGGRVVGIKAAAGGGTSSLIFLAGAIGFANEEGAAVYPLAVVGSEVHAPLMRVGLLFAATVYAGNIVADNISKTSRSLNDAEVSLNTALGVWVDVGSHTVAVTGKPLNIDVWCNTKILGGGSNGVAYRVHRYRGGSLEHTSRTFGGYCSDGPLAAYNSQPFSDRQVPAAGVVTFVVQGLRGNTGPSMANDACTITTTEHLTQGA